MQIQKTKPGYKLVKSLFGKYEEIPEEWNVEKLSSMVAKSISYGVLVPDSDPNGVPMIRSGELDVQGGIQRNIVMISKQLEDKYKKTRLAGGELLVSLVGYTGQITIVPKEYNGYNVSRAIGVIELKKEYNNKFYYYCLKSNSMQKKFFYDSIGSAQYVINLEKLRKLTVVIPPIREQQKIASILSNVDNLIEKYDYIIDSTKRLKTGLMQQLLTKGIGHKKFKKLTQIPKYLEIEIPEEWKIVSFNDVTFRITYGFTNPMPYTEKGPWVIRATNIVDGKINYDTAIHTDEKSFNELISDKSRPKIDTVLLTKDGVYLGKTAVVDKENICINQSVASIEPKEKLILSKFLRTLFDLHIFKMIIKVFDDSTAIPHISITDIPKWKFGLPKISEQQKIISILEGMDSKISDLESKKTNLTNLKKGLVQKLLTGQIQV